MNQQYSPGTFGHLVTNLGLTWSELQRETGIRHTTVMRWALANQEGRNVVLRVDHHRIATLFGILNDRAGTRGKYQPQHFGMRWPNSGQNAPVETMNAVEQSTYRLNMDLVVRRDVREQFERLRLIGKRARSGVEQVAWASAWRRFCQSNFPHTLESALKTPPRGVLWYQP